MEAWPAGAATATRAHPRRARFYCYIKVPRPPLPDGKPPVCGDGGPCGRRASRSGLPFGSHGKEPSFVRPRLGGGSAGCGPSRIRGRRRASKVTGSPQPSASQRGPTYCRPQSNLHFFNHPPLPGFGKCGLKLGDLKVQVANFRTLPQAGAPGEAFLMKMGVASILSPRPFWAALGTKRPYFTG